MPNLMSRNNVKHCLVALVLIAASFSVLIATGSPQTADQVTDDTNRTSTENEAETWLPVASCAVQVTIVVPK